MSRSASATGETLASVARESGRKLEEQLEVLKNAPPREIRTEVVDPLTCTPALLNLLAYDRDISRFDGEPLELFRRRVAYAFVNARDAGSVEGFISIFERLGIGYVELMERQPGIDWDVIQVRVTDSQIATNTQLMIQIIRQYGRTCRRYQFEVITSERLTIRAGWDQGEYVVYPAALSGTETSSATYSAGL
ncbi:hypothetical protein RYT22_000068 [Salmonella enterica]|nr:hypothetical protein [Salmonella enterica]